MKLTLTFCRTQLRRRILTLPPKTTKRTAAVCAAPAAALEKTHPFRVIRCFMKPFLERLKKYCSQFGARIFGFCPAMAGFGEGAGLKNPVTETKRRQKPKRPLFRFPSPNGYSIF